MNSSVLCKISALVFILILNYASASVQHVVKVGVFNGFPVIFRDKDGTIKGLYDDVLKEIGREENIDFVYVYGTWQEGLERIKTGEVDMLTSMGYTEERAQYMDYCRNPLLTVWGELYTVKSSELNGLLDVSGKRIGVLNGDIFYEKFSDLITKFGISARLVVLNSYDEVLQAVSSGQVDAGLVDVTYGTAKYMEYRLRPTGIVFNPVDIYFTTAKSRNNELRALLDSYLDRWRHQEDSVYSKARQKWLYGSVGAVTVIPSWLKILLIILGSIFAAALGFIVILKLQVRRATASILQRENALLESENLYRSLIENSLTGIYIIQDGFFRFANRKFCDILGYTFEEVVDKMNPVLIAFPDDRKLVEENIRKRINGDIDSIEYAFRIVRKDGITIHVKVLGGAFIHKSRPAIMGTLIDISESIKTEMALVESEKKYRDIYNSAIEGIFQTAPDGHLISSNPAYASTFGFDSPEEITSFVNDIGNQLYAYPEDRARLLHLVREYGRVKNFEVEACTRDGKRIWISINATAIYDDDNRIKNVNGTMIDITERKVAEDALRESEETFRALMENTVDIIMRFDADCRYLYVNPAIMTLTGVEPDAFIGKTNRDMGFPEDLCNLWDNSIRKVFESRNVERVLFQSPGGAWIDWFLIPEFSASNSVSAVITSARDITEYRKLEYQLQQAQKMETVGTLAGGLAHDFNNILSGVMGPLSLMQHKLNSNREIPDDLLKRYIDMMLISCRRATEVIAQLLSLSKKRDFEFMPVNLNESISNVLKICENSFDKAIEFKVFYHPSPAYISADQTQVEQVLLNLLVNSSHAMTIMRRSRDNWGGVITITLERITVDSIFQNYNADAESGEYWLLSVKDTGVGIKSEDIPRIFDPFFSTKDKENGTGLGLSIVYSIVRNFRGFITVYSEPDKGTSFNVYFPLLNEIEADSRNSDLKKKICYGEGTILVADDEGTVRNIMKEYLEECGYDVLLAENGSDCIDVFNKEKSKINAVILDMSMPEMSGKDAYIALKKINPYVRVLISSGFRDDCRVDEVLALGVSGFVQKPVTLEVLSEAVRKLLND